MKERRGLFLDGPNNFLIVMADAADGQTGEEIQIFPAVFIPHITVPRFHEPQRLTFERVQKMFQLKFKIGVCVLTHLIIRVLDSNEIPFFPLMMSTSPTPF